MTRTLKTLNTWSELSKIMTQPIGIIFNITHAMPKPNQMSTEGRKVITLFYLMGPFLKRKEIGLAVRNKINI